MSWPVPKWRSMSGNIWRSRTMPTARPSRSTWTGNCGSTAQACIHSISPATPTSGAAVISGTQYRFEGSIDDVGLWGTALDQATIAGIMTNGAASYTTGQISNWKLNEPAGTIGTNSVIDSTAGKHPGSIAADLAFGAAGANANTGTSANFSNASIDVPFEEALNPESFTVTVWARPETAGSVYQSVITSRDDAFPDLAGYILYSTPGGIWQFWTGPGVGAGGWDGVDGPAVEAGEWVHLAISFDAESNEKVLWVNGEPFSDEGAGAGYSPNGVKDLHIGGGADSGTEFRFKGNIDDVGVFNEVLSQAQIMSIMANGVQAYLGITGDYNANGTLDAGDLDLQAEQMVLNPVPPPAGFDLNGDNKVDFNDRLFWLHDLKETWVGDADLNGLFDSNDFVLAFQAGKYEVAGANATWRARRLERRQVVHQRRFCRGLCRRRIRGRSAAGRGQRRARTEQRRAGPAGSGWPDACSSPPRIAARD